MLRNTRPFNVWGIPDFRPLRIHKRRSPHRPATRRRSRARHHIAASRTSLRTSHEVARENANLVRRQIRATPKTTPTRKHETVALHHQRFW